MSSSDDTEKNLDPTPARREKFRKEGRFARARDLGAIVGTLTVIAAVVGFRGVYAQAMDTMFTRCHGDLEALGRGDGPALFSTVFGALLAMCAPTALAAAFGAFIAGVVQAGLRFDTDNLDFKPERLNPFPKLKQLFSPGNGMFETLLSCLRVGAVGYIAYLAVIKEIPSLFALAFSPITTSMTTVAHIIIWLILKVLFALAILAVVDFGYSKITIWKEMKMSPREVKDEHRSQEGDPQVKARIRGRARAMARRRMMGDVKKADVIVTNPTHVAVALRYGEKDPAPIVIAKGHDDFAMQIRSEARRHGIPIIESRALARALDAEVPVGHPIPGIHFAAVAQVLAFVYKIRGRRAQPPTPKAPSPQTVN